MLKRQGASKYVGYNGRFEEMGQSQTQKKEDGIK
jgi:hypothetical protein